MRGEVAKIEGHLRNLRDQQAAHQLVLDADSASIDVRGVEKAIAAHEEEIAQIFQLSDVLADLATTLDRLDQAPCTTTSSPASPQARTPSPTTGCGRASWTAPN